MALTPGNRLGPYEIISALGAGGMGEVYKARDTRLSRTVAIKVLPLDAAADVAARARFEREARAIATLSHPNICTVHDVGRHDDTDYLVMELLDGETLADRIARAKGPLALDQVLSTGIAIADALDKAHRAGIVHRDLKPANVMLTKTGPKLLDFGLAKLHGAASPVALSGETDTTTAGPGTAKGTILGTIHYMAPEQVEGREADARTDIWALGAVLYEMATGLRPFDGESPASIVGAILKDTPTPLSTRQPFTPPDFSRLVSKCLNKEADERWQSAKDLHDELQWVRENASSHAARHAGVDTHRHRLAWGLVVIAVVAAAGLAIPAARHLREVPTSMPETRTAINTAGTTGESPFALSPDGQQMAFVSSARGESSLWVRPLNSTEARQLPGTDGATYPFWSPDSRSVGFFADAKLKRIDIAGGRPQSLADAVSGSGGSWNADGVIVYSPGEPLLFRIPAAGGTAVAVTRLLDRQTLHRFPTFLPDGHQFLFFVQGAPDVAGIYLGSLASVDAHRLTPTGTAGAALLSRWLLWVRDGTLFAQRLDVGRGALTGDPLTVADSVTVGPDSVAALSVSGTGLVAYRAGGPAIRQLVWFDRSGTQVGTMGAPVAGNLISPGLSPDGQRVAASRTVQGNTDIWILDADGVSRFTFDAALDRFPIWSPDGSRVVFDSNRTGHRQLYQKRTDGAGGDELLLASVQDVGAMSWSPDGRFLLYRSQDPVTLSDLWVLPLEGDRTPRVFLKTPFDERTGAFSPDGKWVAYQSNASGPLEIYVRPFAASGAPSDAQWQISTAGGIQPRWKADGQELYYIAPDGTLMAVPIAVQGGIIRPGVPVRLFRTRIEGGGANSNAKQQYDVAADGRFLINVTVNDATATPITLVQNWNPDAKK